MLYDKLYLAEPEVQVLDGGDVSALLIGLLQFQRFLCRLLCQELPLVSDGREASLSKNNSQCVTIMYKLNYCIIKIHSAVFA